MLDDVLSKGEWEALLFQTPQQVKPLVCRLALFHHAIEPSTPADCPLCGQHSDQQERTLFSAV